MDTGDSAIVFLFISKQLIYNLYNTCNINVICAPINLSKILTLPSQLSAESNNDSNFKNSNAVLLLLLSLNYVEFSIKNIPCHPCTGVGTSFDFTYKAYFE